MTDPNIFNQLFIWPILNLIIAFYKSLLFLKIPGALGFAVILMTAFIRLILHPLTIKQLKSTHNLTKLKPQLDLLSKKHKGDKIKLQQAQLQLYKEAGINPMAGCLPLLVQMPILIALYNVFLALLNNNNLLETMDKINKVVYSPLLRIDRLDLSFFGMNLANKPSEWQKISWLLLLIPVITGLLQYWQTKLMVLQQPTPATNSPGKNLQQIGGQTPEKKPDGENMGVVMQKQMSIMMPLMIGFFAYSFPIGLALYWNTFTIFGIIEQKHLNKIMENDNAQKTKERK